MRITLIRFLEKKQEQLALKLTDYEDKIVQEANMYYKNDDMDTGDAKIKELAKSFVPSILSSSASQKVVEHAIKSMEKVPEETYKKVLECLVTFNRYNEFPLIKIPCCLIAGSEDNNSPSKTMLKMSKKLSGSEFYNIENTGHLVNLEAPEKTNNIIIDFLKRIK